MLHSDKLKPVMFLLVLSHLDEVTKVLCCEQKKNTTYIFLSGGPICTSTCYHPSDKKGQGRPLCITSSVARQGMIDLCTDPTTLHYVNTKNKTGVRSLIQQHAMRNTYGR